MNFPLTMYGRPWVEIRQTSTGAYVKHWHEIGRNTLGVVTVICPAGWDYDKNTISVPQVMTTLEKRNEELLTPEQAFEQLKTMPLHPVSVMAGYNHEIHL
jgi:hypothetical protein